MRKQHSRQISANLCLWSVLAKMRASERQMRLVTSSCAGRSMHRSSQQHTIHSIPIHTTTTLQAVEVSFVGSFVGSLRLRAARRRLRRRMVGCIHNTTLHRLHPCTGRAVGHKLGTSDCLRPPNICLQHEAGVHDPHVLSLHFIICLWPGIGAGGGLPDPLAWGLPWAGSPGW